MKAHNEILERKVRARTIEHDLADWSRRSEGHTATKSVA